MDRLKELMAMGTQLGLAGTDLQNWVTDFQEKERLERSELRAERARAEEAKTHFAALELEAKLVAERNAEAEREHERKKELLQLQVQEEASVPRGTAGDAEVSVVRTNKYVPKLPPFDEDKDNIDAYLRRFETFATSQSWTRDRWAVSLSTLLKGKALDVFSRLATDQALDYGELKDALLRRFEYTEEGFRRRFRNARAEQSETVGQFAARITNYFMRWLDLAKCEHTFDGLRDLLLREQVLNICTTELNLFLRERDPPTLKELTTLADRFVEARHGGARQYLLQKSSKSPNHNTQHKEKESNTASTSRNKHSTSSTGKRQCFFCGSDGHLIAKCPKKNKSGQAGAAHRNPEKKHERHGTSGDKDPCVIKKQKAHEDETLKAVGANDTMPVVQGHINNQLVSVLRDTGCSGIVVKSSLVTETQRLGETQSVRLLDGTDRQVTVAKVTIESPYFCGTTKVWCIDNPLYDIIIGNVEGAHPPDQPNLNYVHSCVGAVETRGQKAKVKQTLSVPSSLKDDVTKEELSTLQHKDPSLMKLWELAETGDVKERNGKKTAFRIVDNLLYRDITDLSQCQTTQLIVPSSLRETVLRLAHDSILAGHLGIKKTTDRILVEFFWPGCMGDISRYCKSCDICQRTVHKGSIRKVPLGDMPIIDRPFEKVAVDLIGPLIPPSDRGHRYILTLVDCATRYPEAVPLKKIETEDVAEALVEIFTRVGIPKEMLSDRGAQFTSGLMEEIGRLLSMRRTFTTPYHPAANGLVERFNGTLKLMLRRMCAERPRDWDRYIHPLLFAYREVPQESTGFAPFEMIYGHDVRGPLRILRELWTKTFPDPEVKTTYQYVLDLTTKLEETCALARENLKAAKVSQAKYYNRKAQQRDMMVGQKVLVLRPMKQNKLQLQWRGPYTIVQKIGEVDYKVDVAGKPKTFHANMLRHYQERGTEPDTLPDKGAFANAAISVIHDLTEMENSGPDQIEDSSNFMSPCLEATESIDDIHSASELSEDQTRELKTLLNEFKDTFTDLPGRTTLATHSITTTTDKPVRVKPYPTPYHTRETIRKEVEKMLAMDVIEQSDSDYSAPVVLIRKRDGTCRFCIDYRQLNKVTVFDAEPMPSAEDLFVKLAGCRYFSKIDLSKGYWQVPMDDDAKRKSAFSTPFGLFQFKVMSFGLMNAPATFSRLMRKLLDNMEGLDNFLDDILIFSISWKDHLETLRPLFERLKSANLTARPSKCYFGFSSVECLGHIVGDDLIRPTPEKIEAIKAAPQPMTKKQVRSFMGLANYYRKFIPNFATIAVPLTDLTKKGLPNKVQWTEAQERAFTTLKSLLTSNPILRLPNLEEKFTLRTDASDTGLGAILLQDFDGKKHPVSYASRKLLPRERRYSVVEKECLGLVWGVNKFTQYLLGRDFDIETDHQPLTCLTRKNVANSRIMRWALLLQPYRMTIKAIPGRENVGADYLSRLDS